MPRKISNPIKIGAPAPAPIEARPAPIIKPIITIEDGREAVAAGIIDQDGFEDRFKVPY